MMFLSRALWAWCFLVLLSPNLLAELRDVHASLGLSALRLFFAASLIALPWILLRPRWFSWTLVPLSILAILEILHIGMMGEPSNVGMIHSLFETTPREVREFVGRSWPALVAAFAALSATVAALWANRSSPGWNPGFRTRLLAGFVVVLGIASQPIHVLWHFRHVQDPVAIQEDMVQQIQRTFPFGTLWKVSEVTHKQYVLSRRKDLIHRFAWHPVRSSGTDTAEVYVVVIGESSRAGNWSLFGYPRPTTPRLQSDTGIIAFSDVTSGANITLESVPQILTLATPEHPEVFDTTSSLVSCFRQAGFKTWWLSTQAQFTKWDVNPTKIGREADIQAFLGAQGSDATTDAPLLPALDAALSDTAHRKLIVLHTFGSHFRYANRVPPEFRVFGQAGVDDTIASYDNSILYTDWLLEQVLERLRAHGGVAGFAYIGDHGEALGEGGHFFHCHPRPARAEFEVPQLVWLSPPLVARRPGIASELRRHREAKATTSDFPATLLEIAGIRSDRVDLTRSLASTSYRERPRRAITPNHTLIDVDTLSGSSFSVPCARADLRASPAL